MKDPNILYDYIWSKDELDPYRKMYDDWKGELVSLRPIVEIVTSGSLMTTTLILIKSFRHMCHTSRDWQQISF